MRQVIVRIAGGREISCPFQSSLFDGSRGVHSIAGVGGSKLSPGKEPRMVSALPSSVPSAPTTTTTTITTFTQPPRAHKRRKKEKRRGSEKGKKSRQNYTIGTIHSTPLRCETTLSNKMEKHFLNTGTRNARRRGKSGGEKDV
jgi:hypothetical protein